MPESRAKKMMYWNDKKKKRKEKKTHFFSSAPTVSSLLEKKIYGKLSPAFVIIMDKTSLANS